MNPACPYFGTCGGCQTQHVSYEQQVLNKRERLATLLKTHYHGELRVITGEPYAYRNRMDFITSPAATGFRDTTGRTLVDIERCAISDERINSLLGEVRTWVTEQAVDVFDPKAKRGTLKYAVIRAADDTCVSFMLNEDSARTGAVIGQIKAFADRTSADHVVIAYSPSHADESVSLESFAVKGSGTLTATICGRTITYASQGFFQNNTALADAMVRYVATLLESEDTGTKTLLDLYGGVGTFGVPLAHLFGRVISIESFPDAKAAVLANARANGLSNVEAVTDDAANFAKHDAPHDAIALIDPPRAGLSEKMIKALLSRKPPLIVYVSCNPLSLVKELTRLCAFYTVETAALIDLFPQTNHMECVVTLRLARPR